MVGNGGGGGGAVGEKTVFRLSISGSSEDLSTKRDDGEEGLLLLSKLLGASESSPDESWEEVEDTSTKRDDGGDISARNEGGESGGRKSASSGSVSSMSSSNLANMFRLWFPFWVICGGCNWSCVPHAC